MLYSFQMLLASASSSSELSILLLMSSSCFHFTWCALSAPRRKSCNSRAKWRKNFFPSYARVRGRNRHLKSFHSVAKGQINLEKKILEQELSEKAKGKKSIKLGSQISQFSTWSSGDGFFISILKFHILRFYLICVE